VSDYGAGMIEGRMLERANALGILMTELRAYEDDPKRLDSLEETATYLALKRAYLKIKESKWT
jgi:hypothetical protein